MPISGRDPLRVPAQFWQRPEVTEALDARDIGRLFRLLRQYCGASQTRIGTAVGMTQSTVSLIVARGKPVTMLTVFERIADGLDMPDQARMRLGLAPKGVDTVRRRTALGAGLVALSPATLTAVLGESAAEAMDFTRQRTMSSVGAGTLDHLEAVVIDLDRSYPWRPASELFPVARFYRQRVEQFINGKHTLAEARELYVRAAHLSYLLSDLASDLGSHLTAEAYAIDSYQHAELAGHDEACAWASSSLTCWAANAGQPARAAAAAHRGLNKAPRNSPIAARLHGRAALTYALQGNQSACIDRLAEARNLCDQLPDESPSRFATEDRDLTSCIVTRMTAWCHNQLGNYQEAERHTRDALAVEAWSPGEADLNRLDLGIALAHRGSPDEAAERGKQALARPRFLGALLPRARELDAVLMKRYPADPGTQEFHEQYQLIASQATEH
jgi:tetratricopeptide (TPR) repeat protein